MAPGVGVMADDYETRVRRDFQLGPARPPDPQKQADPIEERARQMLAVSKEFHLDLSPAEARKRAKAELEAEAKQAADGGQEDSDNA